MITRQECERAIDRMADYFESTNSEIAEAQFDMVFGDESYREAWIQTVMELGSIENMDEQSKIWFEEDEESYKEQLKRRLEDYEKSVKFVEILSEKLESLELDD